MTTSSPATGKFEATILFCDIREFTKLFDDRDPQEALDFASTVLAALAESVEESHGVVDKFTGDGFLAHFGVQTTGRNHALDACHSVLRMRQTLMSLNSKRYVSDQPVITFGVGIHTGMVAAGVISTGQKKEFTVMGSTVNQTSRLEGLTKRFIVDCLLSEETRSRLGDQLLLQAMPETQLRGVSKPTRTHWLLPNNHLS